MGQGRESLQRGRRHPRCAVHARTREAAFYGPKIDFVIKDVIGREWQLGTVQVDYQLPQRFDLSYVGADNKPHRPVMIHRAPFGSMERFVGVLTEHFGGAFPLWLAPVQVAVLSISEKFNDYANQVAAALREAGLRVEANLSGEKVGAKIRDATMQKIPYMLVIGEREVAAKVVAVRVRAGDQGQVPLDEIVQRLKHEAASRALSGASDGGDLNDRAQSCAVRSSGFSLSVRSASFSLPMYGKMRQFRQPEGWRSNEQPEG